MSWLASSSVLATRRSADGDHLGLAAQPDVRLCGVARGERGVLDLAQRVHGLDERHSPSLLGDGAHLAREPVVAVHQVVTPRRVRGLGPEQLECELAQLAGKIRFIQVFERSGGEMADHDAGR